MTSQSSIVFILYSIQRVLNSTKIVFLTFDFNTVITNVVIKKKNIYEHHASERLVKTKKNQFIG